MKVITHCQAKVAIFISFNNMDNHSKKDHSRDISFSLSQFTFVCLNRLDALYPSGQVDGKHTNGNWGFSFAKLILPYQLSRHKQRKRLKSEWALRSRLHFALTARSVLIFPD